MDRIFSHTNIDRVYEYLSRFYHDWYEYRHEVVGNVYGRELPIPFNLNTLELVYGERAPHLEKLLIDNFGEGARVPILELMNHENEELQEIAQYVYENVFLKYTMKQWGKSPKEIDPAVSGRVPVLCPEITVIFRINIRDFQRKDLHRFLKKCSIIRVLKYV